MCSHIFVHFFFNSIVLTSVSLDFLWEVWKDGCERLGVLLLLSRLF